MTWRGAISPHHSPLLCGALAAKQSPLSLCGGMDCVATLAKTWMGPICQHDTPSLRGALATKQSILSLWRRGLLRGTLSSGAHSRDPLARNDGLKSPYSNLTFAALSIGHHFALSAFCHAPSPSGAGFSPGGLRHPRLSNFLP